MAELLGVDSIARDCTLLEAGGHSLDVVTLRSRLEQRFDVELRISDLFHFGSPRLLAQLVSSAAPRVRPAARERPATASIPVTDAQQAVYLASAAGSTVYNVPVVLELNGTVSLLLLRRALEALVLRHPALRARFALQDGQIVQRFDDTCSVPFLQRRVREADLDQEISRFRQVFDLERGPLLRACVFHHEQRRTLLLDIHHLAIDGVSLEVLLRELGACVEGRALSPCPDYVTALTAHERLRGTALWDEAAAYWSGVMAAIDQQPSLSHRVARDERGGGCVRLPVSAELARSVLPVCKRLGTTLHCFFLAALNVLLSKLTNQSDVLVGVPSNGRSGIETDGVVGLFVRTLPARHSVDLGASFESLLTEVSSHHLKRLEYQFYPELGALGGGTNGRYEVVYTTQRFDFDAASLGKMRPFYYPEAHFPLLFYVVEDDGALELVVEYDKERYSDLTAHTYATCFLALCGALAAEPSRPVRSFGLLAEDEAARVASRFNFRAPSPPAGSITSRFAAVAAQHADSVALRSRTDALTYAELDQLTSRLAGALRRRGVVPGDMVAVLSDRRPGYVTALLAILKCGAAYVPLDPDYPHPRLCEMVQAASCRLVVSLQTQAPAFEVDTCGWAALLAEATADTSADLPRIAEVENDATAYVMFTSGSTGRPKGVAVTHRNVLRLVSTDNAVPLDSGLRVLLTGSPSFDATTYEVWAPLLHGGQLAVIEKDTLLDVRALRSAVESFAPTTMWMTAPLFARLVQQDARLFEGVDYLIVGGDVVPPDAVRAVQTATPGVLVINGYGPTENTTFSTFYPVPMGHEGALPVGRPLAHSSAFVLDAGMNLLPPGAVGELYVGGDGVAIGYVGDPGLTQSRFIEHVLPDGRHERLYRTGDLARWDDEGTIHLLGRADSQIKVRGFRVEPNEVRAQLCACDGVEDAFVDYHRGEPQEGLVAYVVASAAFEPTDALEYLRSHLPDYMVPSLYCEVSELPLNINGKIDRGRLPGGLKYWRPEASLSRSSPPQGDVETELARIWCELLSQPSVGRHDDFFGCGGHSLLAMQLISRLRNAYAVELTIGDIFAAPTIARLADHLYELELSDSDADEVAKLNAEIASLSEAELRSLLDDRDQG
jgi:amino acid adenylation domain-containing protein